MQFIKKYFNVLFIVFVSLSVTTSLFACPCFNRGILYSEFMNNKSTQCHIYLNGNIIYKMEMSDAKHSASSTHTACSFHTDYQNVNQSFGLFYLSDHSGCIREIQEACKLLKQNILLRDE